MSPKVVTFDGKSFPKVKTCSSLKAKNQNKRFLVTAALPYVNNVPHLGNIVGSHLPADIFARYCRSKGYETLFIGGTDEHGTPVEIAAQKENLKPKELCDKLFVLHKKYYDWLGISYDNFSRTSKDIHYKFTQKFFLKLHKNGFIFEDTLRLPYCSKCKRFLPDRFVEGTCPHCGAAGARGDQCDACVRLLEPTELKNPYCVICKSTPVVRETKHLFLDLPKLEKKILDYVKNSGHWKDNVRNSALGWLNEGLKPRCITRDLEWGVPVPLKGFEKKVFYVWFDALQGYISFTEEFCEKNLLDFEKWWKGKDTKIIHFIGKDNIPIHSVLWPGLLIGNGEYELPWQIGGLEYLNYESGKFSKSKHVGIFLDDVLELNFEPDVWRYYLINIIPETSDSEFSWEDFESKINNELVANFGNFVNRVLTFIDKNFDSTVPDGKIDDRGKELLDKINPEKIGELIYNLKFREALKEIFAISSEWNKYFQDSRPWETIKTDKKKCAATLYACIQAIARLSVLIEPFLPFTAEKIKNQLGEKNLGSWDKIKEIQRGHKLGKIRILFSKVEKEEIGILKVKFSEKNNSAKRR